MNHELDRVSDHEGCFRMELDVIKGRYLMAAGGGGGVGLTSSCSVAFWMGLLDGSLTSCSRSGNT
jgi:hypothetical protein